MVTVFCQAQEVLVSSSKTMVGLRGAETYPVMLTGVEVLARIGLRPRDPPLDIPVLAERANDGEEWSLFLVRRPAVSAGAGR
jgi:hypothetical protein